MTLSTEPLCEQCDKPTCILYLQKPRHAGRREESEKEKIILPNHYSQVKDKLQNKFGGSIVNLVCHRNDTMRFEHEEWLLSGDWHIREHKFILVRDYIWSLVYMEE